MTTRKLISQTAATVRWIYSRRQLATSNFLTKISHLPDEDQRPKVTSKRVGVVGIPLKFGQSRSGVEMAPTKLREATLIHKLEELNIDVLDYGDVDIAQIEDDKPAFKMYNPKTHALNSQRISDTVSRILADGRMCITLGGDHSLGFGSVHGHAAANPNVCVIWIDAHADLNTPLTSFSGNFHGMPASFLIHEVQEYVPEMTEFSNLRSCIGADDIVFIGLRALDPAEKILLDKCNIRHYSMHDIDKKGIVTVLKETLDHLKAESDRSIHLSVDIDSLDPLFASSTGTPVAGGLTLREVLYITEEVHKTGNLSVVDLVELNPDMEKEKLNETIAAALAILMKSVGDKRGGFLPQSYIIEKPEDYGVSSRADELVDYDED